jgi:hypothetical protein
MHLLHGACAVSARARGREMGCPGVIGSEDAALRTAGYLILPMAPFVAAGMASTVALRRPPTCGVFALPCHERFALPEVHMSRVIQRSAR